MDNEVIDTLFLCTVTTGIKSAEFGVVHWTQFITNNPDRNLLSGLGDHK